MKYYVYLIFSLHGLYVGKGSGNRVKESMKERHGIFYIIISRHHREKAALKTEARYIKFLRTICVPIQNGRSPLRGFARLFSSFIIAIFWAFIFFLLLLWLFG